MSGYYTAPVKLDERATALVSCRGALERARRATDAMDAALAQVMAEVAAGAVSTPEMSAVRFEVLRALEEHRRWLETTRRDISGTRIPDSYQQTTLAGLRAMESGLARVETGVAQGTEQIAGAFARFQRAVGADERLVTARAELRQALQDLQASGDVLSEWLPERYAELTARLSDVQGQARALVDARDESAVASAAEQLAADAATLVTGVAEAVGSAAERREQIGRRDYLVASLASVCEGLGFERIEAPASGEADVVSMRFDTLDRGVIDFRIGLDGRIVTDSAIDPAYCATQFDELGSALAAEYGLATRFTKLQESDERPRSQTFEAAEEPTYGSRTLPDPE